MITLLVLAAAWIGGAGLGVYLHILMRGKPRHSCLQQHRGFTFPHARFHTEQLPSLARKGFLSQYPAAVRSQRSQASP